MKKILLLMFVFSLFLLAACNSDENDINLFPDTIDLILERAEHETTYNVTGITIALVDAKNDFTWAYGFGYADTLQNELVTADTMFPIGSIAKTFTAIAIMQLVEDGLIDLDEPIVTYLPQFSVLPSRGGVGNYENITVRMLLNHTSGIQPDSSFWTLAGNPDGRDYLNNLLLDAISEQTMIFEEGTRVQYSNIGYNLLGMLVATVSGYDDFFEGFINYTNERIFAPAGMNHSTFDITDEILADMAKPYMLIDMQARNILWVEGLPTGGMVSTANDMARFIHTILGDIIAEDEQFLTHDSFIKMIDFDHLEIDSTSGITFGLGFIRTTNPAGFSTVGHGGAIPNYFSQMVIHLETGIGVFVSVNSAGGNPLAFELADEILQSAVYEKTGELNQDQ